MKRIGIFLSVLVMVIGLSVSAYATLQDMGDGTIYDTDTQLSWLKNANTAGYMTWDQAVAWAASLNSGSGFAGLTGWRLPNTAQPDTSCGWNFDPGGGFPIQYYGYNCTGGEMGHLYYTELGNAAYVLTNVGPFTNLQQYGYWSGTEYAPDPSMAWYFFFAIGYQVNEYKYPVNYVWAVRDGARSVCGNGTVESGEQCDDGSVAAGDGCSATCTIESGWTCAGSPSVCNIPDIPDTFSPTGSMGTTRYHSDAFTLTRLCDGRVLAAGGGNYIASAEIYDPASGTWTPTGSMSSARYGHGATLLPNCKVLVSGGANLSNEFQTAAEIFDPFSGTWSSTGSMSLGRHNHTSILLNNGKVLIAAGAYTRPYDTYATNSAELYDPDTGMWSTTGSLNQARFSHQATLLSDGKVMIAGGMPQGICGSCDLASIELYDPNAGTWAYTGSMAIGRRHTFTLTSLPDSRVLVAGGTISWTANATALTEIYNPSTGIWTSTTPMPTTRTGHSATLLPDGSVLVAGGYVGGPINTAIIFNPSAQTWSYTTGTMSNNRAHHLAVGLFNGSVLITGGLDGSTYFSSAELYTPLNAGAVIKLPDTGQTQSYTGTFGEDHDYTINPPSYTDNGNGTITDNNTGLIWQKCSVGQTNDASCSGPAATNNWYEATGTVEPAYNPGGATNVCGALTLGGHTDWRMPTGRELLGIMDYSINYWSGNPMITASYFPNTNRASYWSSTSYANDTANAWGVDFSLGHVHNITPKTDNKNVRCVRGQSPMQSFTDNENGTVTDNSTGLMWQQLDDNTTRNWEQAITYCEGLSLSDYSDWRLPNAKELESIYNYTANNPAINTTYFTNAKAAIYWTSTLYLPDMWAGSPVWGVNFDYSVTTSVTTATKTGGYYARCVRGSAGIEVPIYTIIASAGAGGSITPSGSVAVTNGWSQSFTITPNTGYHVADVLVDGSSVGAVISYSFANVTTGHTISAIFAINTYSVSASTGPNGGLDGTTPTPQTVNYNGTTSFKFNADTGYHVAGVGGCGVSYSNTANAVNTYTATTGAVTADCAVSATFAVNTYALTVSKVGTGSGMVTSSPTGITCGSDCSETYSYNTVVTLTASAATGSTFTGWSGACTGTGTCQVTMDAAKSVTATFTLYVGPGVYMSRVSVDSQGNQANSSSDHSYSISSDGRYVAFSSAASNLVAGDTNNASDVFRKDVQTGEIVRVATDSYGDQMNAHSSSPSISADGRYIAFWSYTFLVTSGSIFRKDLETGELIIVSSDSFGNQANYGSWEPSISSDGRYVAFYSGASNLVSGDTNGVYDVFRKDLVTGEIISVSVDSSGNQANSYSLCPSISSNGRYIVFFSDASNLVPTDTNGMYDIFRKDLQTGETVRVSVGYSGEEANNQSWYPPSISSDGRFIAFGSSASNLVPNDINLQEDIFRKDLLTGEIVMLSLNSDGEQANYWSERPSLSSDGRYVAFRSAASNLLSDDTNGVTDVFRKDSETGEILRVSVDSSGNQANGMNNMPPSVSSDARYIIFYSDASNLVSGDSNGSGDVFLADMNLYPFTPPPDTIPVPFAFTDQTGVALSTVVTSNTITVLGINAPAVISISVCSSILCEYSVNGGAFTSASGTVNNGDTVTVRQTSSSSYSTTTYTTLTIGGVSGPFSITTLAADTANLAGIWNLMANGVSVGCTINTPCQSDPPYHCGTANCGSFQMGGQIYVSQSGTALSASSVDVNGHPYTLNGSVTGNSVTFTIAGTGITPGIGPATTTYTGTVNGNTMNGSFTGYASWTYINGGIPITETATWTGIFDVTILSGVVTHTVTPVAGAHGTISPSSPLIVNDGATVSFTLTAGANYHLASVLGTCGGILAGNTFTTSPVAADCTVKANFATVGEWVTLGPEGGHFTSLALSPNYSADRTIFAGSYNFGVPKRSTDGGLTWTQIYNGFQREQPITMAVSPNYSSDNTVLAGTNGQGLFKSEDRGGSWVQSGISVLTVSSIAFSPNYALDNTIFVAGSNLGGVYKTTDGGMTWTQIISNTSIYSVAVSPNNATDHTVFAAGWGCNISFSPNYATDNTVFGCGAIYKSIDGGMTWSQTDAGAFGKSTDAGLSWTQLSIHPYVIALSPNFGADGTVFAGTWNGELYKSIDAGLSWARVFSSASNSTSWSGIQSIALPGNYAADNTVFVATISHGIFRSTNAGLNWSHLDISNNTVGHIAFSPDFSSDGTVFINADVGGGGLYKSTDGAITWHLSNTGIVGTQLIKTIGLSPNFTTDSTVFLGDQNGKIYRSADKGATWNNVYTIPTGSTIFAIAISPGYSADGVVFAGSNNGVYKSTDRGFTWLPAGLSGIAMQAVVVSPNYTQDRTVFAGTNSGLYKSTDGGASWTLFGFGGNIVLGLALSPGYVSDRTIFAAVVDTAAHIYKSTDGGVSWIQTGTGARIVISPNYTSDGIVFSALWNGGVYKSADRGSSWTLIGEFPHVMRLALPPDFASDKRLFAGMSGDGIYSYSFADIDTIPDQFTFTNETNAPLNIWVMSEIITVSGINAPSLISITGGQYSVNGGSFTASAGTVNNGDRIRVMLTSSANYSTTTTAALTIGGVSGTFSITTLAAPAPTTYTVTPSAGANGSISPSTSQVVSPNATSSFTITPDTGYHIATVGGTCAGMLSANTFSTAPITADCTVSVSFAADTADNTVTSGNGVTVTPAPEATLTFDTVSTGGTAIVTEILNPTALGNFNIIGGTSYDITFTGTFSGPVTVCFTYSDADVSGNENNLKLMHRTPTGWVDITLAGYPDTINNIICGSTTSFSEFAVMEPITNTLPPAANFFYSCDSVTSGKMNLNAAPTRLKGGTNPTYTWTGATCTPSTGLVTSCQLDTATAITLTVNATDVNGNPTSDIETKTLTPCTVTVTPTCGTGSITYPDPLLRNATLTLSGGASTVILINWGDTYLTPGPAPATHTYAYDGKYAVRWTVETTSAAGVTKRLACGPVYATIAPTTALKNTVIVNVVDLTPPTLPLRPGTDYTTVKVLKNGTVKSQGGTAQTGTWTSVPLPGALYDVTVYKYGKVFTCTGALTGAYDSVTKTWKGTVDLTTAIPPATPVTLNCSIP